MMNGYFWVSLFGLVGFYLLDCAANVLNLQTLSKPLPNDFSEVYDADEYRRLQRYESANTGLALFQSSFNLAVLLGFWFAGGFNSLDGFVRGFGLGSVPTGLIYIGVLGLARILLSLPFEAYDAFVIEGRFGFNRTSPATFLGDRVKALLLACLIGGPLLAIVLFLFESGGSFAWVYTWMAITLVTLALVYLAPAIILPLFNKFVPLEEGPLRQAIEKYASANQFPLSGIYVMDGSRRSTKANAFFTGFGKTKKIVLFDTLIRNHTISELVAVLAHEIGHFKLRHIVKHVALSILNTGILLFLASVFMKSRPLFDAFGVQTLSTYAGLTLFLVLYGPLSRLLGIAESFLTRKHEFEADRFAAETTHRAGSMVDALRKLAKSSLVHLTPHPLHVILYHSHPPISKRISALHDLTKP